MFFLAGLNAVSTAVCFMAYELAVNLVIQDKLHEEIHSVWVKLNGSKLTYEVLQKMKYLDCVVTETLRRWTIISTHDRSVSKPYLLEDKNGNKIQLNVGDGVIIPAGPIHMDPKYYSNPQLFDPDRFNDENKHKIQANTFLAFGIGPRNCVIKSTILVVGTLVISL